MIPTKRDRDKAKKDNAALITIVVDTSHIGKLRRPEGVPEKLDAIYRLDMRKTRRLLAVLRGELTEGEGYAVELIDSLGSKHDELERATGYGKAHCDRVRAWYRGENRPEQENTISPATQDARTQIIEEAGRMSTAIDRFVSALQRQGSEQPQDPAAAGRALTWLLEAKAAYDLATRAEATLRDRGERE